MTKLFSLLNPLTNVFPSVGSYLTDLVSLQSGDLLWQLLVGGVSQTQPAVITITKCEELSVSCYHCRMFEPTGHLKQR